jgi:hypothetical protein
MAQLLAMLQEGHSREEIMGIMGRGKGYVSVVVARLKANLLREVINYDFKDYAEYTQRRHEVYCQFTVCMSLLRAGLKNIAVPESEKTIKNALGIGALLPALALALELENFYTVINDRSKYYNIKALVDELKPEYEMQMGLLRKFSEIQFIINNGLPLGDFEKELNAIYRPGAYYRSNLYYFMSQNLVYRYRGDQTALVDSCRAALAFFSKIKTPMPNAVKWNLRRQMIPVLVQQKEYGRAEAAARQCCNEMPVGSYNWNISLIYLALVGFHSGRPKIALEAWRQATSTKMKFKETAAIHDQWQLCRCYLSLYGLTLPGKFRIYKFINSLKVSGKDKTEGNVSVLSAHLLHLWRDGKKEAFGDLAARLPDYIKRHTLPKRSKVFFKLVGCFYQSSYHPNRYEPRIKKLLTELQSTHTNIHTNLFKTEVIPIESQWAMLTEN